MNTTRRGSGGAFVFQFEGLERRTLLAGSGLHAEYFADADLTNSAVVRLDGAVDFAWGRFAPYSGIPADGFSVRWSGSIESARTEQYTLFTQSDDGVRLYVDGELLIDNWSGQGFAERAATVALVTGQRYDVRMEYREVTADATARLLWSSAGAPKQVIPVEHLYPALGTGLRGEYFAGDGLDDLRLVRLDPTLNFAWNAGRPDPAVGGGPFSVRWTGQLLAEQTQRYTLRTAGEGGVRVWVDGVLLIDAWDAQGHVDAAGAIELASGVRYDIRMEHRESTGDRGMRLYWSGAGTPEQIIPQTNLFPTSSTPQESAYFEHGGMRILVQAMDNGTFKIDARPPEPSSPPLLTMPAYPLVSDGATAKFSGGEISVWRNGGVVWAGGAQSILYFGRDVGPGSEVVWQAAAGEVLSGFGEQFGTFNHAGRIVDMWNRDEPGQGSDGSRTYFTAPIVYSSNGYALFATDNTDGAFFLNNDRSGINRYQRAETFVTFYVAAGDGLADLIRKRAEIQGKPRNVPDWAWAPWISRNSYANQAAAMAAIKGHLDQGLPVGAIVHEAWKGGHWLGDFNNIATDRYPDLAGYLNYTRSVGVQNVLWQVPVIHPESPEYAVGVQNRYFVRAPNGSVRLRSGWFAGWANIDFTNPAAVKWWKDMLRPEVRLGFWGIKADDGEDIQPTDVFFDGRRGWQMHNEYSNLQLKALMELLDEEGVPGMLWARSASLGVEQTPAVWAGDQGAEWKNLPRLVMAGLSAGMSGMPFWSHDIGGYWGTPTPELYVRWTQLGALSPLMQYHGQEPREPWLFGNDGLQAYRTMSHLRMNLRPTLMALGAEAAATGLPIMRPMSLHYPHDARFNGEATQYMLGPDLLVAPVLVAGATGRLVKFPAGRWHHALSNVVYEGPSEVFVPIGLRDTPLFLREGAELQLEIAEDAPLGVWRSGVGTRSYAVGSVVDGTAGLDTFILRVNPARTAVELWMNRQPTASATPTRTFPLGGVPSLRLYGGQRRDTLVIDLSNGNPLPAEPIEFLGGLDFDRVQVIGSTGADQFELTPRAFRIGGAILRFDASDTVELNPAGGADGLTVGGPVSLQLRSAREMGSVTIADGASVWLVDTVAALHTGSLEMSNLGRLYIGRGELLVREGDLQRVMELVALGRNGGTNGLWTGPGITSAGLVDPDAGLATASTIDGVVVKYTRNGDTDVNGMIDLDDYFAIDSNVLSPPAEPTYAQGDFNYDGEINLDDYFLIDTAFLTQPGLLSNQGDVLAASVTDGRTTGTSFGAKRRTSTIRRGARHLFSQRRIGLLRTPVASGRE